MTKRKLLIIIVIIALILGAIVISDANRRGEIATQGIEDIVDR
jgi:hypothetical protein